MLAWSSGDQYLPYTAGGFVSATQSTFKPCSEYLWYTSVLPKGVLFAKSMRVPFARHKSTYACLISGFIMPRVYAPCFSCKSVWRHKYHCERNSTEIDPIQAEPHSRPSLDTAQRAACFERGRTAKRNSTEIDPMYAEPHSRPSLHTVSGVDNELSMGGQENEIRRK